MKYYIKSLTLAIAAACGMSAMAADRFVISGSIPGVNDSIRVVLMNVEREKAEKIAETVSTDGSFRITGTVKMPTLCRLSVYRKSNFPVTQPRLMVENTDMKVHFTQPLDSVGSSYVPETMVEVQGGDAARQFAEYIGACSEAENAAINADYRHAEKYFETNDNPDTMAVYKARVDETAARLSRMQRGFITEHPDYHISSVLVFKEMMKTFVYHEDELVAMVESVKVCPDTARINLNNRALDWSRNYCLGRVYSDFALTDDRGAVKHLADYVEAGKYTFIDFWASWCGPCRDAIPHVRKIRELYADRMNVYSISCDEREPAWRKAMEKEKMEWTQLRLTQDQLGAVGRHYLLSAIPRLILLDPQGRIVCSTNLPAEIDKYLEENLK